MEAIQITKRNMREINNKLYGGTEYIFIEPKRQSSKYIDNDIELEDILSKHI